ncbi:MAG: chromate efflux transporter [Chloroflexi bacterium]|nr:chromate efflux transporter [Chloroflexota bacterium]
MISTPLTPTLSPRQRVSLGSILRAYLQVGLTAFGFTILQKLNSLVLGNHWMDEDELNEGLALVQLYPGPIMVDLTAYVGYKLRGVPGALMATLGFILPSFVLMLVLSAAYFAAGSLPWVHALFLGLEALVVGVILNITLDFGQRAIHGKVEAAVALGAFVAMLFKLNAVLIVLAALGLGAWLLRPGVSAAKTPSRSPQPSPVNTSAKRWVAIGSVVAVVLAVAGLSLALRSDVGRMGLSFLKIGSIAFGNGTTIAPLIQAEVVDGHHWLSLSQFADGIALGQVTPGPFLITAAFVGYKMGGVPAAVLATFAIFAPSFAMTLIFTEVFSRVRDLRAVKGALAGVLASFVSLLAVVTWQLGTVGVQGPASLALAAAAFTGVRYFKLDLILVFLGGLILWAGCLALGLA